MKRSDFLKTLGLTAAAAFCNNPIWQTPSLALPAKEQLLDPFETPPLPVALSGDVWHRVVNECPEFLFVRDAVVPWDEKMISTRSLRYHLALESELMEPGQLMPDAAAKGFIENLRYVVAEFIRERHSRSGVAVMYDDPFPIKRDACARVSPFLTVATTNGTRIEVNPQYEAASVTEGIPFPLLTKYGLELNLRAAVIFPPHDYEGEWKPCLGWVARAILCMAEL